MKIGELKEYKGYVGSICIDDGVYHGKLLNIPDLVTYESDGVIGLYDEFKLAVDDFIELKTEIKDRYTIKLEKINAYFKNSDPGYTLRIFKNENEIKIVAVDTVRLLMYETRKSLPYVDKLVTDEQNSSPKIIFTNHMLTHELKNPYIKIIIYDKCGVKRYCTQLQKLSDVMS